jgi:hypothetical protein
MDKRASWRRCRRARFLSELSRDVQAPHADVSMMFEEMDLRLTPTGDVEGNQDAAGGREPWDAPRQARPPLPQLPVANMGAARPPPPPPQATPPGGVSWATPPTPPGELGWRAAPRALITGPVRGACTTCGPPTSAALPRTHKTRRGWSVVRLGGRGGDSPAPLATRWEGRTAFDTTTSAPPKGRVCPADAPHAVSLRATTVPVLLPRDGRVAALRHTAHVPSDLQGLQESGAGQVRRVFLWRARLRACAGLGVPPRSDGQSRPQAQPPPRCSGQATGRCLCSKA